MKRNVFTSVVSIMIVCTLLSTSILSVDNIGMSMVDNDVNMEDGNFLDTSAMSNVVSPEDKIQPSLLSKLTDKNYVKVFVITNDVAMLATSLKGIDYRGNIGTAAPDVKNIATPLLQVPGCALDDIAALPGVMQIIEYQVPTKHSTTAPFADDYSSTSREFGLPTHAHQADRVWDMGYNGTGVNVAIIDTGVDFAHPELIGSQARVPNTPATPYSGWPIAFDSASMDAYVAAVGKSESFDDTWYVNTSSTDPNIIHDINIDGKNDFWRIELVAQDALNNRENLEPPVITNVTYGDNYNDYELNELYAQQNYTDWFFGFNTFANTTDVIYTLYIDIDGKFNSGATFDPLGNYVNATGWSNGVRNPANATHMPEYAVCINRVANDSTGTEDTVEWTDVYSWDNASKTWSVKDLVADLKGSFAYSGYKFTTVMTGKGYMELSIPKKHLNNANNISFMLFTTAAKPTHAFDTVYSDPNVGFTVTNLTSTDVTTLTAFTTMGWGYFSHFYNIDEWGPKETIIPPAFNYPASWKDHGPVHFGYHPDDNLPLTGVCVVASTTAGVYDTVYADLDNNLDFSNDKPMKKGDEISYFDFYDADTKVENYTSYDSGDGFADLSGGMIYYISDGKNPIPYLDQYLLRYHLINDTEDPARPKFIAGNGNLTLFTGELDAGESHGTECASAVVGKGRTYVTDSGTLERTEERHALGMAPGAKIIPIANAYAGNLFDCWVFAAEGYDGNVSTQGDQPQIASNSFGFGIYQDGWDTYSKFIDWLNVYYAEGLTLTASTGDAGPGYGSIDSPASAQSIVTVGGSNDFSSRDPNGLENGPNPTWGNVAGFSGRGPTATGEPKPDIVANGRQAFGALPLNLMTAKDGSIANEIWMGTSLSSSTTAGILALIYQAYYAKHNNTFPDSETAKRLLMSGADDMNYDVLQQGAGIANAYRSACLALELQGISPSVQRWVPGDFNGVRYEAFAKLMMPGTKDSINITLDNHGTSPVDTKISDGILKKYAEYEFADTTAWPYNTGAADPYYNDVWFYISNPGKVGKSPHGVYNLDGTIRYVAGDEDAWNQAELLKITARTNETSMDPNGDGAYDYSYWLDLYDWTDKNGDGEIVSGWDEMNRLSADSPGACTIVLHASEPAKKLHSGLGIGVRLFGDGNSNITWTITVEMFKTVDWSWLSTSKSGMIDVPVSGTNFTATMSVPADAKPGSYDGAIYLESQIPSTETIASNPLIEVAGKVLENTASVKVDNMTLDQTPTKIETNENVVNTTLHVVLTTPIINTLVTDVQNETLATTTSTGVTDEWLTTVDMHSVTNEIVGMSGSSVPVNNEYLGLISDPLQNSIDLKTGELPNLVVDGSLSVYKNNILFTDNAVQVPDELVAAGYSDGSKLVLDHGNVEPGTLALSKGGILLTEGVHFEFDWYSGAITVINMPGPSADIRATYVYHTAYSQHYGTLYFSAPIGLVVISASYSVYDYSSLLEPVLSRGNDVEKHVYPNSATLHINGIALIENEDYTLDYTTGIITLADIYGPLTTLTASYSYYLEGPESYDLKYGRDISQETYPSFANIPYWRQNIKTQKSNLLGFEIYMQENTLTGGTVTAHLMKYKFIDNTFPTPDTESIEIIASSYQKSRVEVVTGWNIFNFPEVVLDLNSNYSLGLENGNYNIGISAGNTYTDGALRTAALNTDGKWNGTGWTIRPYDMAFRTYNGYIAPGSPMMEKNGAPFLDQLATATGEVVRNVGLTEVRGEEVHFNDGWAILENNYVDSIENPKYLQNIELFADGVQLTPFVDFFPMTGCSWYGVPPGEPYEGTEGIPYEAETGNIYTPNNYSGCYVSAAYQYFQPAFDIGGEYSTMPDDNIPLPMQLNNRFVVDCTVKKNGVALAEGVNYTLDRDVGELTLVHTTYNNSVNNETVYTATADISAGFGCGWQKNIINATLFAMLDGVWTPLSGTDWAIDNPLTGKVTININMAAGDTLHAFYNYTRYEQLEIGDVITATYTYHDKYVVDLDNGIVTMVANPVGGENYTISYRHYLPYTKSMQLWGGSAGGSSIGQSNPTNIVAGKYTVYIDGKILQEAGNYALNTITGKLTPLKALLANNTYTISYQYYIAYDVFNLPPIGGIPTDQTQIVPGSYVIKKGLTTLIENVDYILIANNTGKIRLTTQLEPNAYITASYSWYNYVLTPQLMHGSGSAMPNSRIVPGTCIIKNQTGNMPIGTYRIDNTTGVVTFTSQLAPGNIIKADYTWYNTSANHQLPQNQTIIAIYLWNGTTPFTGFTVDNNTENDTYNLITYTTTLGHSMNLKATYWYYTAPVDNVYNLGHKNLVPASWIVRLNGVILTQGIDYDLTMDNDANATVTLLSALAEDEILDISYSYYVPITTATLLFPNVQSVSLSIGATALVPDVDFSVDAYRGVVTFLSPIPPDSIVTANYNYLWTTTIPVLVNIPAIGSSFSVGGENPYTHDLFNTSSFGGGYGNGANSGDWRFYYTIIPEQGLFKNDNVKFLLDFEWEGELTDNNLHVFGKTTQNSNPFALAEFPSERYGDYSLTRVGGSDRTPGFYTTTGGAGEVIALTLSPGLNVIAVQNVKMNGSKVSENLSGNIGNLMTSDLELDIVTNQPKGSTQMWLSSSMELNGISGTAAGPSAPYVSYNHTVNQDDENWANYATFQAQLASGSTTIPLELKDCLILEIRIDGHTDFGYKDVVDLDLGLFLDGSNGQPLDGITQVEEFSAMDADADADETIRLIKPADGTYLVRPFGFTLKSDPGHFDLYITTVQGKGFTVSGGTENAIPPYETSAIDISWVLPGDAAEGKLLGAMFIGPAHAETALLVPITLDYDMTAPLPVGNFPAEGAFSNEKDPQIVASFSDLDKGQIDVRGFELYVDGVDVTHLASPFGTYDRKDADSEIYGTWTGGISYAPPIPLSEGGHIAKAIARDDAGNTRMTEWGFTVDSSAPSFEITNPAESHVYSKNERMTFTGKLEPDTNLRIVGFPSTPIQFMQDGIFAVELPLETGENTFVFRVTDTAGNSRDITRTVIRDNTLPTFTTVRFSTGFTTNSQYTTLSGKLTKSGTMMVNGASISVNSDGSFEKVLKLSEGINTVHLEFTDSAGNIIHNWQNVTLDTVMPTISLDEVPDKVTTQSFVLSGSVEADSEVMVNGKRISLGTRQSTSEFTTTLVLSEGPNIIVIEAQDSAGNVAEVRQVVEYDPGSGGVNTAAIVGLMFILLIVGLILGMFFGPMILGMFGGRKEEPEDIPEPPVEEPQEGEMPETPSETLDEVPEASELKIPEETIPEAPSEPIESIPAEESIPEELPEEPESEVLPDSEAVPEAPETPAEPETAPKASPVTPAEPEDPRIAKLTQAYESGKISKELYEKNLAKFKGQ